MPTPDSSARGLSIHCVLFPFNPEIQPFDANSFTNPYAPRYPSPRSAESHRKHPNRAPISTALSLHALPGTHYPLFLPHEPSNLPRHLHDVAPISLLFSAASAYFPSPRWVYPSTIPDVQTFGPANVPTLLFTEAWCLFALFCELSPFVFNGLQPLFAKHPGWGYVRKPSV